MARRRGVGREAETEGHKAPTISFVQETRGFHFSISSLVLTFLLQWPIFSAQICLFVKISNSNNSI